MPRDVPARFTLTGALTILQDRQIVKEWELCTNSSFTLWEVDDNFESIGKSDGATKPNSVLFSHLFTIKGDQLNPQLV